MKKIIIIALLVFSTNSEIFAQELSVINKSTVKIEELPEYVIITSENTKLIGGINIMIDYKKSSYKDVLEELEDLLQAGKKLKIRNQTDLLNAMSKLGYDYTDAYNANAGTIGAGGGNDVEIFGSESKYRINMVFRKKARHRKD